MAALGVDAVTPIWFDDFLVLAATLNFTRAAEARHVTQPAFSRRIRALEDWLGVQLVDRDVQPIVLTDAGAWFVGAAREQLAATARLPGQAQALVGRRAATLRFAATHALSLTFVPAWLRTVEARASSAGDAASPIELISDVMQRCEEALVEQRVDFVLCHAHAQVAGNLDRRFASATIGRDVLLPVSAPSTVRGGAQRTARHRIGGGPAGDVPILAFSADSGLGRIVATQRGRRIDAAGGRTVVTAHLATVLRSMALDGRGVAWLPRSLVVEDLRRGRLVTAAPTSWRIAIEVRLYRSDARTTPVVAAFWSRATAKGGG